MNRHVFNNIARMERIIIFLENIKRILLLLILFTTPLTIAGQGLPVESPEKAGLSTECLNRIDAVMNDYIQNGKMPGMVTMVIRHGKVLYFKSFGMKDIKAKKEMTNDAIFRIASMSKAITTAAVMTLYEEGYFLLTDPVSKFIPEFKNPRVVMKSQTSDSTILVPAKNEITIRQLLNHTSGITYREGLQGSYYRKAGMTVGLTPTEGTIGEMIRKLGSLPLISQPGEEFHYGMSTDVLGYLIELMTSNSIGDLYIFNPFKHNGIMGDKFGYGFGIRTERGIYDELESLGTFGWDGTFYTRFWIDPKEDLIGIFLSQVDNYWNENLIGKFKNLVYQSISD
jgi:CubicO group peptidase (beta-lactamase class C family)